MRIFFCFFQDALYVYVFSPIVRTKTKPTSNPGPFGIEAAREKALVKSGHVTPQILDIFVTWPYYGYASTGGELIEVTEYFLKYLSKHIARNTNHG